MSATRLMTATAMTALGLTLSACAGVSPGAAAMVGDEEISNTHVNEVAAHMCTALADQLESNGTEVPMAFVRQYVVQGLALRSQAEQLAEEHDLTPGPSYATNLTQLRTEAEAFPEEVRADYVELSSTNALANDIVQQLGQQILAEQKISDATPEQISQAGVDAFTTWPDANGVEIDPRYGLKNVDGNLTPVDTSLSVAVGETAKAGLKPEPDAAFVSTLPLTHRCG